MSTLFPILFASSIVSTLFTIVFWYGLITLQATSGLDGILLGVLAVLFSFTTPILIAACFVVYKLSRRGGLDN